MKRVWHVKKKQSTQKTNYKTMYLIEDQRTSPNNSTTKCFGQYITFVERCDGQLQTLLPRRQK